MAEATSEHSGLTVAKHHAFIRLRRNRLGAYRAVCGWGWPGHLPSGPVPPHHLAGSGEGVVMVSPGRSDRRLLVLGARPNSIGYEIERAARQDGWLTKTAGVSNENLHVDVQNMRVLSELFHQQHWNAVVCTVGINGQSSIMNSRYLKVLDDHMATNFQGVMAALHLWVQSWRGVGMPINGHPQFVVISSNSAHIARSMSSAYCASKAALSMAVRCVGREMASWNLSVYGYEPGWVSGTPMSKEVDRRIQSGQPRHRIPGSRELSARELARIVVDNMMAMDRGAGFLNGCMIRLDGGEQ